MDCSPVTRSAPYCRLYDAAREAIRLHRDGLGDPQDNSSTSWQPGRAQQLDQLDCELGRIIDEAYRSPDSTGNNSSRVREVQPLQEDKKRRRQTDVDKAAEEKEINVAQQPVEADDSVDKGNGIIEGGLEDKCLGLFAEAFGDDLDLLRQDEHFRGSAKNMAAMADMMRCLAGGLDKTEQKLFLENVTR